MSSMETPENPNTPPPSDEEIDAAVNHWLFWVGCLSALALTVLGYGGATGSLHFFR